jgi:hypothetical protein
MEDREVFVGRIQTDRIYLYPHPLLRAAHRHLGMLGQEFHHQAFVIRRQVLDHDVGQTRTGRGVSEESLDSLQLTGGGADADIMGR